MSAFPERIMTTPPQSRRYSNQADEGPVRQADDPTPEQIAERSAEIRTRWSARVKKKRHLRAPVQWSVPQVPIAEIDTRPAS